jgi:hypothetical protein
MVGFSAQWFWLQPELEAWDGGDSSTLTAVGCHWGPVIQTSARIGSLGPGRFPYSHCSWVPLRPSDSDFSQNWKPGTGEIPLLSLRFVPLRPSDSDFSQNWKPDTEEIPLLLLWLGAIEAQWFWLRTELEAWYRGDLLSLWLGAIEAQWFRLWTELEVWYRGDSPETRDWGDSPTLFKWSQGFF